MSVLTGDDARGVFAHCGERYTGGIPEPDDLGFPDFSKYPATFCVRCHEFPPGETITSIALKLNGFTHGFFGDLRLLITKPDHFIHRTRAGVLMLDCMSQTYCNNITLTIQHGASPFVRTRFGELLTSTWGPNSFNLPNGLWPLVGSPSSPYRHPNPPTYTTGFSDLIGANVFGCYYVYLLDEANGGRGSMQSMTLVINGVELDRGAEHVLAQ
jgi:hypothetical protein